MSHTRKSPGVDSVPDVRLAAVYARKSNANETAVHGQFETCRQRARKDGWHVPDSPDFLFGDDATSGKTLHRKELDRLIDVVRSKAAPFTRIYIRHRDRLSRSSDLAQRAWFEHECRRNGIQVCYASDKEHRDLRSPKEADLGLHVVESMDDYKSFAELQTIRERLIGATREHVIKKFFVGAVAPFGTERWIARYDDSRTPVMRAPERGGLRLAEHAVILRWREDELPTVRFIFDAIEGGTSLRTLARELNARGAPCPKGAQDWSPEIVSRIARNPLYMGDFHYRRKTTDVEEAVDASEAENLSDSAIYVREYMADPPISKRQFHAVKRLLDGNRERRERRMASSPEYPLTGVLRCSICNARLNGTTHPAGKRTEAYRQYRHPGADRCRTPCPFANKTMRADALDALVLDAVRAVLVDGSLVERARRALQHLRGDEQAEERTRAITALRAKLSTLQAEADVAYKRSVEQEASGDLDLAKLSVQVAKEKLEQRKLCQQQLSHLEAEDVRLEKIEHTLPDLEHDTESLARLFESGAFARKAVVSRVIAKASVDFDAYEATLVMRTSIGKADATLSRCA